MKAVIFDMDGTVIDSGEAIYKTVNELRAELNLSQRMASMDL